MLRHSPGWEREPDKLFCNGDICYWSLSWLPRLVRRTFAPASLLAAAKCSKNGNTHSISLTKLRSHFVLGFPQIFVAAIFRLTNLMMGISPFPKKCCLANILGGVIILFCWQGAWKGLSFGHPSSSSGVSLAHVKENKARNPLRILLSSPYFLFFGVSFTR